MAYVGRLVVVGALVLLSACGDSASEAGDEGAREDAGRELFDMDANASSDEDGLLGSLLGPSGGLGLPPIIAPTAQSGMDAATDASETDAMEDGEADASDVDATTEETFDAASDAGDLDSSIEESTDASVDASIDASTDAAIDTGTPDAASTCSLYEPCCGRSRTCNADLVCAGDRCGCIAQIHGEHFVRADGTVELTSPRMTILDGATGAELTGITQVYQAHDVGCGRRDDGTVWCWPLTINAAVQRLGRGMSPGTLVVGNAYPVLLAPGFMPATPITTVARINQGSSTCYLGVAICAVLTDGRLYCWGDGENGGGGSIFNDGAAGITRYYATPILSAAATPLDGVTAVSTGRRHACVLRGAGDVYCWGANVGGPLGQGNQTALVYPALVPLPGPAQQVGASSDFSCARVSDGVYCWGHNNAGEVGIGPPADNHDGCINFCKLRPAQVVDGNAAAISGIVDLNLNYQGGCGRRSDGSLLCWGSGVGNVATPLLVGGDPPDPVRLLTSCGTNSVTQELRYLSTSSVLYRAATEITNTCP